MFNSSFFLFLCFSRSPMLFLSVYIDVVGQIVPVYSFMSLYVSILYTSVSPCPSISLSLSDHLSISDQLSISHHLSPFVPLSITVPFSLSFSHSFFPLTIISQKRECRAKPLLSVHIAYISLTPFFSVTSCLSDHLSFSDYLSLFTPLSNTISL